MACQIQATGGLPKANLISAHGIKELEIDQRVSSESDDLQIYDMSQFLQHVR